MRGRAVGALLAATTLGLGSVPVGAQTYEVSQPANAVAWTCEQALIRRGYSSAVAYAACAGDAAAQAVWDFAFAQPFIWALEKLGIPWPQNLSNGGCVEDPNTPGFCSQGGSGGGGGAAAGWTEDCATLVYKRDANGNIIVPSMKLPGGTAMTRGGGLGQVKGGAYAGVHYAAKESSMAALYTTHLRNIGRNTDRRRWFGAAWITGAGNYVLRSVGYYAVDGTLVSGGSDTASVAGSYYYLGPQTIPTGPNEADCPAGMDGGTSHFYLQGSPTTTNAQCIWYEPNFALSPSGYLYNWETTVPGGTSSTDKANRALYLQSNPNIASCKLDEELIRKIADAYFKKITEQPGYTGPPYAPIVIDDVRVDGDPPTVEDVYRDPPANPPTDGDRTPPAPIPTPTPTPSATPTGTGDPPTRSDYDHTPVTANEPASGDIDWWPELPTISFNFGTPSCPTYDVSIPDWGWDNMILDSHCTLIEANKSIISAIMLLVFTIIGIRVVLDA